MRSAVATVAAVAAGAWFVALAEGAASEGRGWRRPDAAAPAAGRCDASATVRAASLGATAGAPATRVVAVHPSSPVVPANQLRWYVEFSAPMFEGEAALRAHLIDETGAEVKGAFLEPVEEPWDASGRRLTLLFDPGRVKRGLRAHLDQGVPVVEGGRYTLRIDAEWRDARGRPLAAAYEHEFRVGPDDRSVVDVAGWTLWAPRAGGRAALVVDFGEPLDHALAERVLWVEQGGEAVAGRVTLAAHDSEWRFVPDAPWAGERHELRVAPVLEDLAGNRPGRLFDRDLQAGDRSEASPRLSRAFTPAGGGLFP